VGVTANMKQGLVTGGGGFLGRAIVAQLLALGWKVRCYQRGHYPDLLAAGAEVWTGDLTDIENLKQACQGVDTVFHVAAKAGVWGPCEGYFAANVTGTRHVLEACRANGVQRLVYTSSPSVVFDGRNHEGIDERTPYATRFLASYPQTKAIAEQMVLAANSPELATIALRPHLIWGPGDPHHLPRLIARARIGQLRRISGPITVIDATYIDNAAHAHLLALNSLKPGAACAGRAYFIAQGEPVPTWEFIQAILEAVGHTQTLPSVPPWLARLAGAAAEESYRLLGIQHEPPMTRFVAQELTTSHWFDLKAARQDLGYTAPVSTAEGLRRLAQAHESSHAHHA